MKCFVIDGLLGDRNATVGPDPLDALYNPAAFIPQARLTPTPTLRAPASSLAMIPPSNHPLTSPHNMLHSQSAMGMLTGVHHHHHLHPRGDSPDSEESPRVVVPFSPRVLSSRTQSTSLAAGGGHRPSGMHHAPSMPVLSSSPGDSPNDSLSTSPVSSLSHLPPQPPSSSNRYSSLRLPANSRRTMGARTASESNISTMSAHHGVSGVHLGRSPPSTPPNAPALPPPMFGSGIPPLTMPPALPPALAASRRSSSSFMATTAATVTTPTAPLTTSSRASSIGTMNHPIGFAALEGADDALRRKLSGLDDSRPSSRIARVTSGGVIGEDDEEGSPSLMSPTSSGVGGFAAVPSEGLAGEDYYRLLYAEYLYRVGALEQRVQVLKFVRAPLAWLAACTGNFIYHFTTHIVILIVSHWSPGLVR
jgi:hypothetical protein